MLRNDPLRVLSLCDFTGVMVQPWIDAGHEATIVDLQHTSGREGRLTRRNEDVRETLLPGAAVGYDIVFAFPPCTDLANSGARWFKDKGISRVIAAARR